MNEAAVDGILKEHYGADFDTDKFRTLCREYTSAYFAANGVPQKPGLHEALKSLKNGGYKIAIASSTSRRGVYRNLNDADIANMFDCVICGDMVESLSLSLIYTLRRYGSSVLTLPNVLPLKILKRYTVCLLCRYESDYDT